MRSTPELLAVSALAGFLLQTFAAWLLCLLLARLSPSAHRRFQLWRLLVVAFAARWIWVIAGLLFPHFPAASGIVRESALLPLAPARAVPVSPHWTALLLPVVRALAACYLAGLLFFAARGLARRTRLRRALRYATQPSRALESQFLACARLLPIPPPELWIFPGLSSPATLGWWRPRILLPSACELQPPERLREAFWHELKHIERRDALWTSLAHACHALLWFHPALRSAVSAMAVERELACDLAVVRDHPQHRDSYAACLLHFARLAGNAGPAAPASAIGLAPSASLLEMRVRAILAEERPASLWSHFVRAAASLLLLAAAVVSAPAMRVLLELQPALLPAQPSFRSALASPAVHRQPTRTPSFLHSARAPRPQTPALAVRVDSVAPEHDDALAAQHRAGLTILTQGITDEADAAPSSDQDNRAWHVPDADLASGRHSSLGAVAVSAAEQIGVLAVGGRDHDHDGR
jgi:beta-lactamase regulating signal transducer with metallopeptidase domain